MDNDPGSSKQFSADDRIDARVLHAGPFGQISIGSMSGNNCLN